MEPFGEWAADAEAPSEGSSGGSLVGAGAVVPAGPDELAAVPAEPDEAQAQELVALPPSLARRDLRAFAERGQHLGGAGLQHTENVKAT